MKAGDTLPLLTRKVYGDARIFLRVAAYNQLDHFRELTPGTDLEFPPLKQLIEQTADLPIPDLS